MAPTLSLRNGAHHPRLGLGTWPLAGRGPTRQIRAAIEAGYRLIDTAENYRNEDGVGQGLRDSGIDRSEVFVTTKFNREWHSVDGVRQAYEASRERLGVDYIDLLMVHWPNPDQDRYVEAVRGLQALLERATRGHRRLQLQAGPPAAGAGRDRHRARREPDPAQPVQHPRRQPGLRRRARHHHRVVEPHRGLERRPAQRSGDRRDRRGARQVGHPGGAALARPAGLVAIPRSANPGRIAENIDIFDFELTDDEMAAITALDRGDADVADSDKVGH